MKVQPVQSVLNGHLHAEEEPEEEESLAGTASGFALDPKGSDGSLPRVCARAVLRPPSPKAQPSAVLRYKAGRWTPLHVLQGAAFVATEDQVFSFLLVLSRSGMSRSHLGSPGLQLRYSTARARPRCPLSSVSPAHHSVGLLSSLDVDDLEREKIL